MSGAPGSPAPEGARIPDRPLPVASGADCALVAERIGLRQGTLDFPRQGLFVTEAHYATREESFNGSAYPSVDDAGIEDHLQASCDLLHSRYGFQGSSTCAEVFRYSYERVWTPAEGGGAVGETATGTKPSREQEMFQGNMMYLAGQRPAPGTRYILTNPGNGRSVVVSFGYEVGPSSSTYLGGLTTEVHWALQDTGTTQLRIGRARDQSLPYGPVECAD